MGCSTRKFVHYRGQSRVRERLKAVCARKMLRGTTDTCRVKKRSGGAFAWREEALLRAKMHVVARLLAESESEN